MTKTLFLHIGTHKTGTTSIQAYLRDNAEAIERSGIAVRLENRANGESDANNMDFAHVILRESLMTGQRIRMGFPRQSLWTRVKFIRQFRRYLRSQDNKNVVVSAEALCFARTALERILVRACIASTGFRIKTILVKRNLDDWKSSWLNQLQKDAPVRAYLESTEIPDRIDKPWYFQFGAIVRFWQKFGNVIIICYDKEMQRCGSIIPAFLKTLNVTTNGNVEIFLNARHNVHQ